MQTATTLYFPIDQPKNQLHFSRALQKKIKNIDVARPIIFLCIGSDRATGDSLGPIIGEQLEHRLRQLSGSGSRHIQKKVTIYGTLQQTVHAGNLSVVLSEIYDHYENPFVIAIDASLGVPDHIGYVTLGEGCLRPGIGVRHKLPSAGDIHITGIVNHSTDNNHLTLQTTRLNTVVELSTFISEGILEALHVRSSFQCPQKRHFINIF